MPSSITSTYVSPPSLKMRHSRALPPAITYRTAITTGTGRNRTSRFYDHTSASLQRPRHSATWPHPTRPPKTGCSLSRAVSFPQSIFCFGSRRQSTSHSRQDTPSAHTATSTKTARLANNAVTSSQQSKPITTNGPSTISSPREASFSDVENAGLPSLSEIGKRQEKDEYVEFVSFKCANAKQPSMPPGSKALTNIGSQEDSLAHSHWHQISAPGATDCEPVIDSKRISNMR